MEFIYTIETDGKIAKLCVVPKESRFSPFVLEFKSRIVYEEYSIIVIRNFHNINLL